MFNLYYNNINTFKIIQILFNRFFVFYNSGNIVLKKKQDFSQKSSFIS